MIPVHKGSTTPIFAQPNGKELWVALLEKAFAKFVGDYQGLDGGYPLWGLQALTGDEVSKWKLEGGEWKAVEIRYNKSKSKDMQRQGAGRREVDVNFYKKMEGGKQVTKSPDDFFKALAKWDSDQFLICAGTSGEDEGEATANQGLVQGHAYTIQSVKKVGDFRMLRLRNPWGKFEWTGDVSTATVCHLIHQLSSDAERCRPTVVGRLGAVVYAQQGEEGVRRRRAGRRRLLLDGVERLHHALPEHRHLPQVQDAAGRAAGYPRGCGLQGADHRVRWRLLQLLLHVQGRLRAVLPDGPPARPHAPGGAGALRGCGRVSTSTM